MVIHTVYIIFMIFRLIECKSSSDIKYKIQIQMEENILEIDIRGGALITFYVQTNNIFCINHCLFCQQILMSVLRTQLSVIIFVKTPLEVTSVHVPVMTTLQKKDTSVVIKVIFVSLKFVFGTTVLLLYSINSLLTILQF